MDLNKNHVVCPQGRKVKNHRSEQSKWRGRKRWKDLVRDHAHTPEAECAHCHRHHKELRNGKPVYLTINHLSRSLYVTEDLYCTWNDELMEICCTTCNWMVESGKVICPVCNNQYIKINEQDGMCRHCYYKQNPDEARKAREESNRKKAASRALLKNLRAAEKERVKAYKKANPIPKVSATRQKQLRLQS